ncbi:MAG: glucose-6-phosphate dehydrogenase, partial [Chloroflexi bacterium]|nr:glucose-6-phosphate dehydrogenase [Chloroflexota bacterium]
MAASKSNTTIVIFGASGDLSQRKLLPGLFNLCRKGRLPAGFRIVGFALRPWDDATFQTAARSGVNEFAEFPFTSAEWDEFAPRLAYLSGDFSDPAAYRQLAERLAAAENGPADRLYYLATPPVFYAQIVSNLGAAGLSAETEGWRRVIIEKPFGHDEPSARALNQSIHRVLDERQIYRIDHYLGKETVQNILVSRFANTIYEPLWNRNYVDHVQI